MTSSLDLVAKGVILSISRTEAYDFRIAALDRFWLHTSPRSLQQGGLRGFYSKPVLFVLDGPFYWKDCLPALLPVFQNVHPRVFIIRHAP